MPFIIIGIALAAAGFGAWALMRGDDDAGSPKAPAPSTPKTNAPAAALFNSPAAVENVTDAESPATPERSANEPNERFAGSPEAMLEPVTVIATTPAFLDSTPFDPGVEYGGPAPFDPEEPFGDDEVALARDLASAPDSGSLGLTDAELK